MTDAPLTFDDVMRGRTGIEIDEAIVKKADWEAAQKRDPAAKKRIRESLDGIGLYFHLIGIADDEVVVNIKDLHEIGCIGGVSISKDEV